MGTFDMQYCLRQLRGLQEFHGHTNGGYLVRYKNKEQCCQDNPSFEDLCPEANCTRNINLLHSRFQNSLNGVHAQKVPSKLEVFADSTATRSCSDYSRWAFPED